MGFQGSSPTVSAILQYYSNIGVWLCLSQTKGRPQDGHKWCPVFIMDVRFNFVEITMFPISFKLSM